MRSGIDRHSNAYLQQLKEQRGFMEGKKPAMNKMIWLLLIPVALISLFLIPPLLPLLIIGGVAYSIINKKKNGGAQERHLEREHRKKKDEDGVFHVTSAPPVSEIHENDGVVWLSEEKRLEQLKTLRDAGIIEQEEYQQRKKRIHNGP